MLSTSMVFMLLVMITIIMITILVVTVIAFLLCIIITYGYYCDTLLLLSNPRAKGYPISRLPSIYYIPQ